MASNTNLEVKIMTFNSDPSTSKPTTKPTTEDTRFLLGRLFRANSEYKPDVAFLPELLKVKIKDFECFQQQEGNKYNTILVEEELWRAHAQELNQDNGAVDDTIYTNKIQVKLTEKNIEYSNGKERIVNVKLNIGGKDVLLVCWHGPYKLDKTYREKKYVFRLLLNYIIELMDQWDVSYLILGGDFNIDIECVKGIFDEENYRQFQCNDYASDDLKDHIDYFVTSRNITLSDQARQELPDTVPSVKNWDQKKGGYTHPIVMASAAET